MKNMTKTLRWRLGRLPHPSEVVELLEKKIITKDEAREILFSQGEQEELETKDLKSEIRFLREIIEKLSKNNTQIVEIIREVEKPIRGNLPWLNPYQIWCGSSTTAVTNPQMNCISATYTNSAFSDIQTF